MSLMRFCVLALLAVATSAFSVAPASLSLRSSRGSAVSRHAGLRLKMQEDNQSSPPPSPKRVGASIDADGKGNVWAVEPKMQVDDGEAKNPLFVPGLLVGGLVGLLGILALTPLTNPEQL